MPELYFDGGLNEQDDLQVRPEECIDGENFLMNKPNRSFVPRAPFQLKGTAPGSATALLQLIKRDNTETTLVAAGSNVFEWDGGSEFDSVGSIDSGGKLRGTYWSLDDYLVVTDINKLNVVSQWNGSAFTAQTTGLPNPLYAKHGIVHAGRMWLFNVTEGFTEYPHMCLASEFEDAESYDTTVRAAEGGISATDAFYLLTPDLKPINAAIEWYGSLFISTEDGKLFRLTGTDSSDFAWKEFFEGSAGVAPEGLVNIGNDLLWVREGGIIESLVSTDQFGDVSVDDISRWIPVSRSICDGTIAVYDRINQLAYFFIPTDQTALVLDKETWLSRPEISPWTKYTSSISGGLAPNHAMYMRRPGTSNYSVYWCNSLGQIFDINGTRGAGDSGETAINTFRKTGRILNQDVYNNPISGRLEYRRISEVTCEMCFLWADTFLERCVNVNLKSPNIVEPASYYGGGAYYNDDDYYNNIEISGVKPIVNAGFSPQGKGIGYFLTMTIDSLKNFEITRLAM